MEYPVTSRTILLELPSRGEELLIVGLALAWTLAALLSPLALPLAVTGVVFVLAAL
ncbi:MAG: hypothetical protein ACXVJ1_15110 [Candidatus Angelobacter sp.]